MLGSYAGRAYWVAASDAITEGEWLWADTLYVANLTWGTNQPDQGAVSNCACLWKAFQYDIADEPCHSIYNFICEIE